MRKDDGAQVALQAGSGRLHGGHADRAVGVVLDELRGVVDHANTSPAALGTHLNPVKRHRDGSLVPVRVGGNCGGKSGSVSRASQKQVGTGAEGLIDAVGGRVREASRRHCEGIAASSGGHVSAGHCI
jgi:hypothetical protein